LFLLRCLTAGYGTSQTHVPFERQSGYAAGGDIAEWPKVTGCSHNLDRIPAAQQHWSNIFSHHAHATFGPIAYDAMAATNLHRIHP
jgi:hypothetical protein